jgi:hypothetical protein
VSDKLIRKTLETVLKTWADARSPALPVAFENVPFTPPAGAYLACYMLPADNQIDDMQGTHIRFVGVFQINVYVPINQGAGAALGIADELRTLFPAYSVKTNGSTDVWIDSAVRVGRGDSLENRYMIPVSFQYRSDTIA